MLRYLREHIRIYAAENKALLGFFFAGFILRLLFSHFYPLTLDKSWSRFLAPFSFERIASEIKADSTSPIMTYLVHKLFKSFNQEVLIRLPFWLSGFASLFFIYNISEKRISSIAIASLSFFIVKEGSIARMHSLTLLFSCASLYFFLRTFESSRKENFIMFSFFSILTAYNFYPALSLTASLFACYFILSKDSASPLRYYLTSFFLFLFLSVPAFYFLDVFSLKSRFISDFSLPTGAFLPYLLHSFSFSEEFFPYKEIKSIKIILFSLITMPVLFIFIKGVTARFSVKIKIVSFSMLFSLLIFFLVSLKIPKVLYSPKYLICLYPGFVYIMSRGIDALSRLKSLIFLSLTAAVNIAAFYKGIIHNKENWRLAAEVVSSIVEPNEKIFIFSEQMKYPFSFYYKKTFISLSDKIDSEKIWSENPSAILYIKSHDYEGRSSIYQNEIEKKLKLTWYLKNGDIEFFRYKER